MAKADIIELQPERPPHEVTLEEARKFEDLQLIGQVARAAHYVVLAPLPEQRDRAQAAFDLLHPLLEERGLTFTVPKSAIVRMAELEDAEAAVRGKKGPVKRTPKARIVAEPRI